MKFPCFPRYNPSQTKAGTQNIASPEGKTHSSSAYHCTHSIAMGCSFYVSLASKHSRTNAWDGYTDMKTLPRGIAGNEYLCNKDSKKSLHFLLSKERIKTVPGKHSYHPHQLLNTLCTAIKHTPEDIPHNIGSPQPSSSTT